MEKLVYKVFEDKGKTKVKIEGIGERCCIKDNDGKLYFRVPNLYSNDNLKLFFGKIKEAYQTVLDGNGDAIIVDIFNRGHETVCKYIDEEYGKKIRDKFLKGWEGTKFAYSIKFGFTDSIYDGSLINDSEELIGLYGDIYSCMKFDTEEEAQKYIDEIIIPNAKRILRGYNKAKKYHTEERYLEKWCDFNKVSAKIFCEMDDMRKSDVTNKTYYIKPVQVLKK